MVDDHPKIHYKVKKKENNIHEVKVTFKNKWISQQNPFIFYSHETDAVKSWGTIKTIFFYNKVK